MLYVAIALVLEPAWGAPIDIVRSIMGFGVVGVILVLFVLRRSWVAPVLLVSGIALLGTYVFQFIERVMAYSAVDPEFGVLQTSWLKLSMLVSAPLELAQQGFLFRATAELYWHVCMPILQMLIVAATAYQLTRRPSLKALA